MTLSKGDIINLSAPGPNMISSAMSLVFNIPLLFEIDILLLLKNIKDNINISFNKLIKIIDSSDNKINHAIWLLDIYKNNIKRLK